MTTNNKPKRIVKRCGNCGWTDAGPTPINGKECKHPIPTCVWTMKARVWPNEGQECQCWKERAK